MPKELIPSSPISNTDTTKQARFWKLIITATAIIAIVSGGYIAYTLTKNSATDSVNNAPQNVFLPNATEPTPTPMPFYELTIPYLQNREYVSSLGSREQVTEAASYTSYVTSYDSDGYKINGLLTIPKGIEPAGGWPAIVFVHGYIPPRNYQTTVNYIAFVDSLARNGFVVFKIDLRGHGRSEGDASGAYYSSDYVIDTLNAHAALASSDFVNPKKIGLWGHSMAGNITLRSLAARPEIPAVVIWAGVVYSYTDVRQYGINDNSYQPSQASTQSASRRQKIRELYGDPTKESVFWQQVAPTNYLSAIRGAVQIHHALDDAAVDMAYSRDLMALFDQTSAIHELHEYQSGGHNITGSSYTTAMQRTVEFYKKYLGTP